MPEEKVKLYKRLLAYIIDFVVVILLSTIIISILPNNAKYNTVVENNQVLQDMLIKNTISKEAYLTESVSLTYDSYKFGLLENSVTIIIMLLYFSLLTYFNHGRTLGKIVMKIEVKDKNGNDPSIFQSLLRSILITRVFGDIITLFLVCFMKKVTFVNIYRYFDMVITILWITCPFVSMFREDGRGLHDLIAGTIVLNKRKHTTEEIVEAKIEEKEEKKTGKNNNNKKKNNK